MSRKFLVKPNHEIGFNLNKIPIHHKHNCFSRHRLSLQKRFIERRSIIVVTPCSVIDHPGIIVSVIHSQLAKAAGNAPHRRCRMLFYRKLLLNYLCHNVIKKTRLWTEINHIMMHSVCNVQCSLAVHIYQVTGENLSLLIMTLWCQEWN